MRSYFISGNIVISHTWGLTQVDGCSPDLLLGFSQAAIHGIKPSLSYLLRDSSFFDTNGQSSGSLPEYQWKGCFLLQDRDQDLESSPPRSFPPLYPVLSSSKTLLLSSRIWDFRDSGLEFCFWSRIIGQIWKPLPRPSWSRSGSGRSCLRWAA